jgi:hypothetical protein
MALFACSKLKLAMLGMLRFIARQAPDDSAAAATTHAAKHPSRNTPLPPPPNDCPRFRLLFSSLKKALDSAAKDSAPGPSGLPVSDMVRIFNFSSFEGTLTLDLFFVVAGHVTAGRAPTVGADVMAFNTLIGIPKKGTTPDVRLIAMGEEFRKLFGKAVVVQMGAAIKAHFNPLQFGIAQGGV